MPPQFNRAGWKAFLGQEPGTDTGPSHAVPARAVSLENLPPIWIGVRSIDLFFLEDKLFAERLVKSGVPTEFVTIEGAYHGFDVVDPSSAPARRFEKSMLDALRKA
ncbi:alpha/beta hydrolase [Pseudomonas sp. S32]|uniref:alpha/beta hydrolase n=1 Tax=Pseudomonas sp. S32 TaxID=2767448 RepID=UPI0019126771|nr:alpha/beta hydrolase [Pseudomonas sp. S32]